MTGNVPNQKMTFMALDERIARSFSGDDKPTREVATNASNILDLGNPEQFKNFEKWFRDFGLDRYNEEYFQVIEQGIEGPNGRFEWDDIDQLLRFAKEKNYGILEMPSITKWMQEQGYDGFFVREEQQSSSTPDNIAVFDPTKIKSIEPETTTLSGQVIPPSQRFDVTKANVNFMPSKETTKEGKDEQIKEILEDLQRLWQGGRGNIPQEPQFYDNLSKVIKSIDQGELAETSINKLLNPEYKDLVDEYISKNFDPAKNYIYTTSYKESTRKALTEQDAKADREETKAREALKNGFYVDATGVTYPSRIIGAHDGAIPWESLSKVPFSFNKASIMDLGDYDASFGGMVLGQGYIDGSDRKILGVPFLYNGDQVFLTTGSELAKLNKGYSPIGGTYSVSGKDPNSIASQIKNNEAIKTSLNQSFLDNPNEYYVLESSNFEAPEVEYVPVKYQDTQGNENFMPKAKMDEDNMEKAYRDVTKRTPEVVDAVKKYQKGEIDQQDLFKVIRKYMPYRQMDEVPEPATREEMERALNEDKVPDIGKANETLKDGDLVGLRLDIPAYKDYGVWVASIHDAKEQKLGKIKGYDSVAIANDVEFITNPSVSMDIATGDKNKTSYARMVGKWEATTPEAARKEAEAAMSDPAYIQVGMNPFRNSWFYDRKTGNPVVNADRVIQIGGLVMAKNPVFASPQDPRFMTKYGVNFMPASKLDSAHAKAIESGDMEEAQRLVDERAREAGFIGPVYHGSQEKGITTFLTQNPPRRTGDSSDSEIGSFFTDNIPATKQFSSINEINPFTGELKQTQSGKLYSVFVSGNIAELKNDLMNEIADKANYPIEGYWDKDMWVNMKQITNFAGASKVRDILTDMGFDGVSVKTSVDSVTKNKSKSGYKKITQYAIFNPENIESADPATYDNEGKLIPLSQRFDTSKPDIRFMPAKKSEQPVVDKEGFVFPKDPAKPFKFTQQMMVNFMPAEGVNLEDYQDKPIIALPCDRMGVGDLYVGPTGAKQKLSVKGQGGPGFIKLQDNGIWAFTTEDTANRFMLRINEEAEKQGTDSILVAPTLQSPINHLKNPTGQKGYVEGMEAAVKAKILTKKDLDAQIKSISNAITKSEAQSLSKPTKEKWANIQSWEEFKTAVYSKQLNFQDTAPYLVQLDRKRHPVTAKELEKIGLLPTDIARDLADDRFFNLKFGSVVALFEVKKNAQPFASDFHDSYGWQVPGRPVGFIKNIYNVDELTSDPRIRNKAGVVQTQPLQTVLPLLNRVSDVLKDLKIEPTIIRP
jgi:hypothetical protein